jgi:hypothetical protein
MDPKVYEVQCAERLFLAITSYHTEGVRKFKLDKACTESSITFAMASDMLKTSAWHTITEHSYKSAFDEVEIDVLVHVYSPTTDAIELGPSFFRLRPDPGESIPVCPFLKRQISENSIAADSNSYAVAEISIDGSVEMVRMKICQLERDLAFLLSRARVSFKDDTISVGNIIRLAVLMTPSARIDEVCKFLKANRSKLPLVYSLWQQDRLYLAKIQPRHGYIADKLKELNSVSDIISSQSGSQKIVTVGFAGKYVTLNVANCSWEEFLAKVKESALGFSGEEDAFGIYKNVDGDFSLIESIDILEHQGKYSVLMKKATLKDFFESLKNQFDDDMQDKSINVVSQVFADQGIGIKQVLHLTDKSLQEIGITKFGVRAAILAVLGCTSPFSGSKDNL